MLNNMIGLVYYRVEDIERIIDALRLAHNGERGDEFNAALDAVCAAVGVKPKETTPMFNVQVFTCRPS